MELILVQLHDAQTADDLGLVELPNGWRLGSDDLLLDCECRLVRVVQLVS